MEPCQQEPVIKMMDKKLDKIDTKVDMLLAEYWKQKGRTAAITVGISTAVSGIGLLINLVFK